MRLMLIAAVLLAACGPDEVPMDPLEQTDAGVAVDASADAGLFDAGAEPVCGVDEWTAPGCGGRCCSREACIASTGMTLEQCWDAQDRNWRSCESMGGHVDGDWCLFTARCSDDRGQLEGCACHGGMHERAPCEYR